jgi:hypothetical protein
MHARATWRDLKGVAAMNTLKVGRRRVPWMLMCGALFAASSASVVQAAIDDGFTTGVLSEGAAVAVWNDTLAVGVPKRETGFPSLANAGSVRIYKRDPENAQGWMLFQELYSPNPGSGNYFGSAVALQDNFLVIGEPGYAGNQGRVTVFVSSAGFFQYQGDQVGGAASRAGSSLALARHNADTPYIVLAGAPTSSFGGVYASAWDVAGETATSAGTTFIDAADFAPADTASQLFGNSVAIVPEKCIPATACLDSFIVAIGAPGHGLSAGYVSVFALSVIPELDSWNLVLHKHALDPTTKAGEFFGASVALDAGDAVSKPPKLAVGAPYAENQNPLPVTTGAVDVFQRPLDDLQWDNGTPIYGPTGQTDHSAFGTELHLRSEEIWVGAPYYDVPAQFGNVVNAGAVFRFEYSASGNWDQTHELHRESPANDDYLGSSIGCHSGRLIAGAPGADGFNTWTNADESPESIFGGDFETFVCGG